MAERFIVVHHPKDASGPKEQGFTRKGLAFAYVKRRLPGDANGAIRVHLQTSPDDARWTPTDTWTFHKDGNIEHERTAQS